METSLLGFREIFYSFVQKPNQKNLHAMNQAFQAVIVKWENDVMFWDSVKLTHKRIREYFSASQAVKESTAISLLVRDANYMFNLFSNSQEYAC